MPTTEQSTNSVLNFNISEAVMIRIEALRVFVEVAEHGNIRDAADRLGRTPSALSMTLKQIEDHLGTPLFQTDRKSAMTETGQFLLDAARLLLRDYDRSMELILDHAKAKRGRLRLASVPSVAVTLMPAALQSFLRDRPGVQIDLVDTNSTNVCHLVETGQADLGIAGAMEPTAGLSFTPLFSDPMALVCRADTVAVPPGRRVQWEDLEGLVFILNETTRNLRGEAFRQLARKSTLSVRNVTSLLAMVQAGMGVTLLPVLATTNLPSTLTALQIDDPACRRLVGIWRRTGHVESPLTNAFADQFARIAWQLAESHGLDRP